MIPKLRVPAEVSRITETLENAGFEAYLVGGCVRDLLNSGEAKDWDVTTNAKPEQIQGLFEETFYENDYGTVGVVNKETEGKSYHVVEVTPYRLEATYSNSRHPDSVTFSDKLEEDLKRRDFTMNAVAYSPSKNEIIDLYDGQKDIKRRVIKAVGDPKDRFSEDALRILRAIRLSAQLDFAIDSDTEAAIAETAQTLDKISIERIRDEFMRILNTKQPMPALGRAQILGVLKHISPEFDRGVGCEQNQAHKYDVFEHLLRTMQHAADKDWSFDIRLAGLFHDISKPETRRWSKEKEDWTFHGHEVVGARITKKELQRLKFPKKTVDYITTLVRWHMFFSDPDKITLSAVRRMINNVGGEQQMWDLLNLRICDRIGTGRPKEQPFRLRKYIAMVEEALRDPISVGRLKIDGQRLMEVIRETPGPRIGHLLHALLEEVLDDPSKNTTEYLEKKALELAKLDDQQLIEIGKSGREKLEDAEAAELKKIKKKYSVT